MNNSFKRTFFKGFSKFYFNSSSQFKFYSPINSQKQISGIKNLFFAQNILQLAKSSFMLNAIMKSNIMLMLSGENSSSLAEDIDTVIQNIINGDTSLSLLKNGMLCERKINI